MNAPTPPDALNPDVATAVMGHNNPPAFDQAIVVELKERSTLFLEVTKQWIELDEIKTENQAELCADQITGLRKLWKEADDSRKVAKKPHDTAAKAVQDAFKPILLKLEKAADALKPKLETYATKRAEEEAREKAAAEAKAREELKAAEDAARVAEADGDIDAQVEAEAKAKEAESVAKAAAKAPSQKIKSATGGGRTMSLRSVKEVEIKNINVLFMHFKETPQVVELLKSLATASVRSKDYDHAANPVPGINVVEAKRMA